MGIIIHRMPVIFSSPARNSFEAQGLAHGPNLLIFSPGYGGADVGGASERCAALARPAGPLPIAVLVLYVIFRNRAGLRGFGAGRLALPTPWASSARLLAVLVFLCALYARLLASALRSPESLFLAPTCSSFSRLWPWSRCRPPRPDVGVAMERP